MSLNSKKNTRLSLILNSYTESNKVSSFYKVIANSKVLNTYYYKNFYSLKDTREQANCIYKDLLGLLSA